MLRKTFKNYPPRALWEVSKVGWKGQEQDGMDF